MSCGRAPQPPHKPTASLARSRRRQASHGRAPLARPPAPCPCYAAAKGARATSRKAGSSRWPSWGAAGTRRARARGAAARRPQGARAAARGAAGSRSALRYLGSTSRCRTPPVLWARDLILAPAPARGDAVGSLEHVGPGLAPAAVVPPRPERSAIRRLEIQPFEQPDLSQFCTLGRITACA